MKKLIALSVVLGATISVRALPVYDNFSTYGTAGSLLGGNTAPSGESWILYTNETTGNLVANSNVYVTNYFIGSGSSDSTSAYTLPAGFAGPHATGNDTSANSIWTPGYLLANSPLGGIGACLKFASPVANISGNKIFASFFVDVPAITGNGDTYGAGQSEGFGWNAGFLQSSELPSPNSTTGQNTIPSIFEKFNAREASSTTWKPGIGYNNATSGAGLASAGSGVAQQTTHFIVIDYEFNGGTGSDVVRIWLDPSANFGAGTQPTSSASTSPGAATSLANAGGFFFLAYCQNDASLPAGGIIYNSLSIGTNWAYVTGGAQFVTYEPYAVTSVGQTLVLNPAAAAGGGVSCNYAWANSSGPLNGGRFSVNPTTGALTIANVQATDADTYTLSVSTPITTENSVAPITTQTLVAVFTSENASAIGSGQFTLNYTGPVGQNYRIWSTTSLLQTPVLSSWNLVTSGTFTSGANTYTDTAASGVSTYYTITMP